MASSTHKPETACVAKSPTLRYWANFIRAKNSVYTWGSLRRLVGRWRVTLVFQPDEVACI